MQTVKIGMNRVPRFSTIVDRLTTVAFSTMLDEADIPSGDDGSHDDDDDMLD